MTSRADIIIVLGAGVLPSGKPSPTLERRTLYGIELYRNGTAPKLLFSGGFGLSGHSEARVMREIAVGQQVPAEDVMIDEQSANTMESAVNCAKIMHGKGWMRAVIVTDSYHRLRSVLAFSRMRLEVEAKCPPEGRGKTAWWRWLFYHLREIAAIPWYLVRLAGKKP